MSDPAATLQDGAWIQRAYALAEEAGGRGDGPYGAVIVGGGNALAEARNRAESDRDPTAHAEVRAIARARAAHDREALAGATLYASTEPCTMCAGAVYQAGIRRVVYGVSGPAAAAVHGRPFAQLSLRELAERSGWEVTIVGPVMEDDGIHVHREHAGARAGG